MQGGLGERGCGGLWLTVMNVSPPVAVHVYIRSDRPAPRDRGVHPGLQEEYVCLVSCMRLAFIAPAHHMHRMYPKSTGGEKLISPMTGEPLADQTIPNHLVKNTVLWYMEDKPWELRLLQAK